MSETQQATEPVIFEFQHTDEQGNPIIDPRTGKPAFTNLTGATEKEVLEKLKDSYLNVTRAFARVRNHKPVPKPEQPAKKELSAEEERQAATDLQDPSKARAAIRKLTGVENIEAEQERLQKAKAEADAKAAAYQFLSAHLTDFYPCQANSAVMTKYITDNELDPTVLDNYEIAFNAVQDQLAQRPAPPAPPAPPKIEPEIQPEAPKKAATGIQPGTLSGQRPAPRKKNEVTRETINEMRRTEQGRQEYKKRMCDPDFVKAVNAAFAST